MPSDCHQHCRSSDSAACARRCLCQRGRSDGRRPRAAGALGDVIHCRERDCAGCSRKTVFRPSRKAQPSTLCSTMSRAGSITDKSSEFPKASARGRSPLAVIWASQRPLTYRLPFETQEYARQLSYRYEAPGEITSPGTVERKQPFPPRLRPHRTSSTSLSRQLLVKNGSSGL